MKECDNELCKDCKVCTCNKKVKKAKEKEERDKRGAFNSKSENWVRFLKREDFVGGEVEHKENGIVYRGHLCSITEEYDSVCLGLSWCASRILPKGEWIKYPIASWSILKTAVIPQEIEDNKVIFIFPASKIIIHPNNGSKLDVKEIKDPPKSNKRLLFLCSDLPFDPKQAQKMLSEMVFEIPQESTLRGFVSKIPSAELRAEFLQKYVDELKIEKNGQSVKN